MPGRPTKLAVALLVVGVAGAVVAGVGPKSTQPWGFGVCVIAALILTAGGLSGGQFFGWRRFRVRVTDKGLAARRAEFGPRSRNVGDAPGPTVDDEAALARELERRRQSGRSD
jgi:hypothetical protein